MSAILIIIVLLAAALIAIAHARRQRTRFEQRFPPISDAEFLTRCGPDTDPEIALKVRRIIADHLAIEYARIHPSMNFVEDIGAG